jgi:hypothetical protein
MSVLHFSAKRYWGWPIIVAIVIGAWIGYQRWVGSAGFGSKKVTVLDPRGQPSGIFGRRGAPDSQMMAIFAPETHPTISRDELVSLRMAPRLDRLDNKTIYLVDTGFAGAKEFLEELQAWFNKNMPAVKTVLRIKGGTPFSDSPEVWAELKQKANGVIFGVGG